MYNSVKGQPWENVDCSVNKGGCEHYCYSAINSSYCGCAPGYFLQNDLHNCSCKLLY